MLLASKCTFLTALRFCSPSLEWSPFYSLLGLFVTPRPAPIRVALSTRLRFLGDTKALWHVLFKIKPTSVIVLIDCLTD